MDQEIILSISKEEAESFDFLTRHEEIVKCAKDFIYFCERYVKVLDFNNNIMPFEMHEYRKRIAKNYEKHPFNILLKFRQCGATTLSVAYGLWKCLFHLDQRVLFVSVTDREALYAGKIAERMCSCLPSWMTKNIEFRNGHLKIFRETGSKFMFHAPVATCETTFNLLLIDEAAFIKDMDHLWACFYPCLSTGGKCIAVSTSYGIGNWFEKTYHNAKHGLNSFNVININYKEHPEYNDPEWEKQVRSQVSERCWRQEFLCEFLVR